MNINIRDANDNMIFVGDILESKRSKTTYKVMFSYYDHMDSGTMAYGFWLCGDDLTTHPMPECDDKMMIKLINTSRL